MGLLDGEQVSGRNSESCSKYLNCNILVLKWPAQEGKKYNNEFSSSQDFVCDGQQRRFD